MFDLVLRGRWFSQDTLITLYWYYLRNVKINYLQIYEVYESDHSVNLVLNLLSVTSWFDFLQFHFCRFHVTLHVLHTILTYLTPHVQLSVVDNFYPYKKQNSDNIDL